MISLEVGWNVHLIPKVLLNLILCRISLYPWISMGGELKDPRNREPPQRAGQGDLREAFEELRPIDPRARAIYEFPGEVARLIDVAYSYRPYRDLINARLKPALGGVVTRGGDERAVEGILEDIMGDTPYLQKEQNTLILKAESRHMAKGRLSVHVGNGTDLLPILEAILFGANAVVVEPDETLTRVLSSMYKERGLEDEARKAGGSVEFVAAGVNEFLGERSELAGKVKFVTAVDLFSEREADERVLKAMLSLLLPEGGKLTTSEFQATPGGKNIFDVAAEMGIKLEQLDDFGNAWNSGKPIKMFLTSRIKK